MPHKILIKVLSEVLDFVLKSKLSFLKTSIYWTSKGAGRKYFTKQMFVNAMSFLRNKCFFTFGK